MLAPWEREEELLKGPPKGRENEKEKGGNEIQPKRLFLSNPSLQQAFVYKQGG